MTLSFSALDLVEPLQRAIAAENYDTPTPIQAQAIPHLLASKDLLGIAQTGTGKTAAFALPILQRLAADRTPLQRRRVRALVLSPTRELAIQIHESFRRYGRHLSLRTAVVFGGVGLQAQIDALARGLDILIATPGRLLDLLNQGFVHLDHVSIFVLDEADRMLDMGFIHDIKKVIAKLPRERQSLFFSATMPASIDALAATILKDPVRVAVTPAATTVERIEQRVYFVDTPQKRQLLIDLLNDAAIARVLVFTRTKHGADRVTQQVERSGIRAEAIHGNKSQSARQRALGNFRSGATRVLVATDIAARGIDIDGITHVINYELPNEPESYVHRIGRTARAGNDGIAISLCDASERPYLRDIEKLTRQKLTVIADHRFHSDAAPPSTATSTRAAQPQRHPARHRQQNRRRHKGHGPSGGDKPHRPKAMHSGAPR